MGSSNNLDKNEKKNLVHHLSDLQKISLEYFPIQKEILSWIQNLFQDCDTSKLPIKEKEPQINIPTDTQLKLEFNQFDIMHFRIDIRNEYFEIAKRPVKHLMSFVSTYMYEKSFSLYAATKKNIQKQIRCRR